MFEINRLQIQFGEEFETKNLGVVKKILGLEIHRDNKIGKLYLLHKKKNEKVLERFGMQGQNQLVLYK